MAYMTYIADPCGNTKFLTDVTTIIITQMDKLDTLVNDLKDVNQTGSSDATDGGSIDP